MMNVLLVDDEPWVLEGLRTMVNWDKYGFQICGEVENGDAAWSLIEDLQPDLVLTDIHMPSLSGLELIDRSMQELAKPPRFVILSGYDSFEYAKIALEQRVEDYLLKPIDEVEIEKVLEQIGRKIQEEQAFEDVHQREQVLYVNSLFNRLLAGEDCSMLKKEVETMLHMKGQENIACLLIETDPYEEDIRSQVRSLTGAYRAELFTDAEGRIGVFSALAEPSQERMKTLGKELYKLYSHRTPMTMALGQHRGGAEATKQAYEKALFALKWKRYQGEDGIIYYEDLPQNEGMTSVNQKALTILMDTILSGEQEKVEGAVRDLLANSDSLMPVSDIDYARVQLLALEMGVRKQLKELDGDVDQFMQDMQNTLGLTTGISSYSAIQEYALRLTQNAMKMLMELRKVKEDSTIFQVVQYVNQEFREKLQLQELAQKFHMNANYLGQAFKQQTGKSFREYLNDKRMEEAKRLLRQSRFNIAEVSLNSGYPNVDYFVSQFKRMTGMAPSAYRKQR